MTLDDALGHWAQTPHPLIANAIDVLSEKALAGYAAPKAKTKAAFHAEWLARAVNADAVGIGWLAKTLRDKLEVHDDHYGVLRDDYARTKYAAWFERLEGLAPYAGDPRVSSALCAVFEDLPYSVWDVRMTTQVYAPVASMLMGSADARVVARLRAVLEKPTAKKQVLRDVAAELLPDLIDTIARLPVHALDDEARWAAFDARRAVRPNVDASKLLEQVLENPHDESARSVYADALIERGEPLGEFIALQLDGSEKSLKRANALLKKHGADWLGSLALVLRGLVFERGFLVEAELAQNAAATPEVWKEAALDRRLATVRRLRKGRGSAEHLYDFYRGGALRSLQCFEVPTQEAFVHLREFKDTVREVVLFERCPRERAENLTELPRLESLGVGGPGEKLSQWVDALARHGLFARLKRVRCESLGSHTPYADAFCDPRIWHGTLEEFEVQHVLRLSKSTEGFTFDFSAWDRGDALAILERFGGTIARARCVNAARLRVEDAQALETAASARGLNIEPLSEWPA